MVQNLSLPHTNSLAQADMTIRILLISDNPVIKDTFRAGPESPNVAATISLYQDAAETANRVSPQILLAEIMGSDDAVKWRIAAELKRKRALPLIVILPAEELNNIQQYPGYDDLIVIPYSNAELLIRINRLIKNTDDGKPELIKCDGLIIDTATCEVTVDGVKVDLTFKEYELLKLLAVSKGRVFTRETLLDKIWGYDYFGGDRTVDVHVRRLRSKIEDATHSYIETVRNIGYKFTKNG
jgi:two-component system alkaline phosphatase synthesis response regulator PhoP